MNLTLLIDLDDTLLPDSSSKFIPAYLNRLGEHFKFLAPPEIVIKTLFSALQHALEFPSISDTIQDNFDQQFYEAFGTTREDQAESLLEFYTNEYRTLSPVSEPDPEVISFIDQAIKSGYRIAIATNPIFPEIATHERLRWAGLAPEDYPFEIISTYENFHFGKPHPAYYLELIAQIGWPDTGFVVVGNDLELDISPAEKLNIPAYLINPETAPEGKISSNGQGIISGVLPWLDTLEEDSLRPDWSGFTSSICRLQANPAALDTLFRRAPESLWESTNNPEEWGLTEIACHLRDVDREVYLPRLATIQRDDNPFIEAVDADAWAEERRYSAQDGPQAFQDFLEVRKKFINLASALPEIIREKTIRHTIFGPTTLEEILQISSLHDSLHVQQVQTLLRGKNRSI